MRIERFEFGSIRVDGLDYTTDIVIAGGKVRRRKKKPSKPLRDAYGHTPLSVLEEIPWDCARLVVGTGAYGSLPVTTDVSAEAKRRGVELLVLPTREAIKALRRSGKGTNAILHVTC